MNEDPTAETTRLRCIRSIISLDDEALQLVDALLSRVAVGDTPAERKPRAKQTKRASAAPAATNEVER